MADKDGWIESSRIRLDDSEQELRVWSLDNWKEREMTDWETLNGKAVMAWGTELNLSQSGIAKPSLEFAPRWKSWVVRAVARILGVPIIIEPIRCNIIRRAANSSVAVGVGKE